MRILLTGVKAIALRLQKDSIASKYTAEEYSSYHTRTYLVF